MGYVARFTVIGSNSFSGSHFVKRLLREEHEVLGIGRSEEVVEVFRPYTWEQSPGAFAFAQIRINDFATLDKALNDFLPDVFVNFATPNAPLRRVSEPRLANL